VYDYIGSKEKIPIAFSKCRSQKSVKKSTSYYELKAREIWDGLAYCLNVKTVENELGQIQQLGFELSLETFKEEGFC
jgi:hypothetical protein